MGLAGCDRASPQRGAGLCNLQARSVRGSDHQFQGDSVNPRRPSELHPRQRLHAEHRSDVVDPVADRFCHAVVWR
jgi:hypothetical protein